MRCMQKALIEKRRRMPRKMVAIIATPNAAHNQVMTLRKMVKIVNPLKPRDWGATRPWTAGTLDRRKTTLAIDVSRFGRTIAVCV